MIVIKFKPTYVRDDNLQVNNSNATQILVEYASEPQHDVENVTI